MKDLVDTWDIPIFDRVTSIDMKYRDLSHTPLDRSVIAKFEDLEQVTFTKNGSAAVRDSERETIKEVVPPCRMVKTDSTRGKVAVKLGPPSVFGCVSN